MKTFITGDLWLVESHGLPEHPMMVGITSWQQQVPVAQPYVGANAWQFPVTPEMAGEPISAKTGLFRGAIGHCHAPRADGLLRRPRVGPDTGARRDPALRHDFPPR